MAKKPKQKKAPPVIEDEFKYEMNRLRAIEMPEAALMEKFKSEIRARIKEGLTRDQAVEAVIAQRAWDLDSRNPLNC